MGAGTRRRSGVGWLHPMAMLGVLALLAGCTATPPPSVAGESATTNTATVAASGTPVPRTTGPVQVAQAAKLMVDASSRYRELLRSLTVSVDGIVIVELYNPGSGPEVTHDIRSVTKSVMSILIGIAVDEGSIAGVDQTLAQLLPAYGPIMAPGVGEVTLEQVLTMTGGLLSDESAPELVTEPDWVAYFLSDPLEQPAGEGWAYSSRGSHLLSAILVEATGKSVLDYAREKLFVPLGISTEPAESGAIVATDYTAYQRGPGFGWLTDPQGLSIGAFSIRITADDMRKLGQLYLDRGEWQGAQVVSADWVAKSTTDHIAPGDPRFGYGYQWWVREVDGRQIISAKGFAGQLIEIVPDLGMVVTVSCLDGPGAFYPEDLEQMVESTLIPALTG